MVAYYSGITNQQLFQYMVGCQLVLYIYFCKSILQLFLAIHPDLLNYTVIRVYFLCFTLTQSNNKRSLKADTNLFIFSSICHNMQLRAFCSQWYSIPSHCLITLSNFKTNSGSTVRIPPFPFTSLPIMKFRMSGIIQLQPFFRQVFFYSVISYLLQQWLL